MVAHSGTLVCERVVLRGALGKQSTRMDSLGISEIWTGNKAPKTFCLNLVSIWGHMSEDENSLF